MSVAALADNRLLRSTDREVAFGEVAIAEVPQGGKVPGVKEGVLNSIVQWIPVETIGAYVFLQQLFLDPLTVPKGQGIETLDYSTRWHIFWIGLGLTVVTVPLYTALKAKLATASFRPPIGETIIGSIAFVLWAVALPDTPLDDWDWWSPDYGVAAITISAVLLNPIATLLNLKAQWGKAPA